MASTMIEVDSTLTLDEDGISNFVYVGHESDTPVVEESVTWNELFDNLIEEKTVPGTDSLVVDIGDIGDICRYDSVQELFAVVEALRSAADDLEERIRSSSIFLRHEWAADGYNKETLDWYCVTYNEYLNNIVEKGAI